MYYKKYGFAVRKVISLDRGPKPVRLQIMVREPRSFDAKAEEPSAVIRAI